ncbi:hypothetical protein JB92DRAFT_3002848 [Gautieria morchelliformis]|nr:hypothetical protein JB92DRAFT_3002848 [Gautieria morchelliformis]
MATFSGAAVDPENMDPLALQPSLPSMPANGDLRIQLQALLDDKEKQLSLVGTLGQRFLAQQMELEERISQLNDLEAAKTSATDDQALETEIRDKLGELKHTMNSWESENQDMFGVLGNKVNGVPPSPTATSLPSFDVEDTSAVHSPTSGPSAAQSSRRAKNAAHRANDVEFAFEIGSSLLTEVRRLQSLLAERDKAIRDMKEEKDDLKKLVEDLTTGLQTQAASAEKYKEENWNLEVTLQELRTQLQDAQTAGQNSEAERKRAAKQLLAARDSIDQHKNEAERLTSKLDEFKAKHETDVAQMRKQAAGLQRDKSDLQSTLEALKSDIAKKDRSIKRFASPLTPNGLSPYTPAQGDGEEEEDVFGTTGGASRRKLDASAMFGQDGLGSDYADSSPDPSPSRPHLAPNHPSNEIEALKQSLAHAHRQVSMLRGTVQREKELRMDYRRKLAEAEGRTEELVDEEEEENIDPTKARSRTARGHGRGAVRHGRGTRSALSQKLAMVPGTPDSEFLDSIDEMEVPDVASEPTLQLEQYGEEDDEQALVDNDDDGISQARDRRISADGMDPAFANVLRSSPSSAVPLHASSPLREMTSVATRGGRRSRGGVPHLAEQRPSSLVEPAGALAAELGMTEEVLGPEFTLSRHVETAEVACQTEPEPEPEPEPQAEAAPAPLPNHDLPPVETCEMAVQVEEVLPQVATSEAGSQAMPSYVDAATDASTAMTSDVHVQTMPAPRTVEMDTQTSPLIIPAPRTVEMDTQTSPLTILAPRTVEMDTQTSPLIIPAPRTVEMDTQTSPLKSKDRESIISLNLGGITRRGTIVAVAPGERLTATDDEGEATETDTGTETEGEYTDAREFPTATTPITGSIADFYSTRSGPQDSTADFHSVQTGPQESTSDFYSVRSGRADSDADDSDQESIKASRLHRTRTSSRTTGVDIALGYAHYQSGVHPPPSPPPRVMSEEAVQVEVKMPELKETSIQTDDWTPPPPPPPVPPEPPAPYSLFRVGAYPQQFQYIAPPTSTPSTPSGSSPQANSSHDSTSTVTTSPRRAGTTSLVTREHLQRASVETALAGDDAVRTRTLSSQTMLAPLDKTRPPTMMLPPPPRMPPPPTIPDKKTSSGSMAPPRDIPPPRPTSPPPPELIQRATTPTFGGSGLLVPFRGQVRQHGASMPPSQQGLGRRPSTNSFRSAANAAVYASVSGATGISPIEAARRQQSTASLVSSRQSSLASRRSSVSSEHHQVRPPQNPAVPAPPTPGRTLQGPDGGTTDPAIIHAITQTMIGEFLYKYTRRVVGKGHGEKRHRRFFWVHPYTKTLYWSSADPGSSAVSESSAKSAYIDSVRSVLDPNPMPPGLHQYSVVVSTPQREMKITAPTKERHDIWLNALNYLLARPSTGLAHSPQTIRSNVNQAVSPAYGSMRLPADEGVHRDVLASPRSARSIGSALSGDSWNITPRAQRSQSRLSTNGSIGKRSGTPAAEYLRLGGPDSHHTSPGKSDYEYVPGRNDDDDLDFEIHDSIANGEGYEGLENVRACCDGRHDLGTLSRKPHHHHHHRHPPHPAGLSQNQSVEPNEPASRPVSPSAWSFRSRAGSTTSHGGDSIWSRFGSKRSKGAPPVPASPGER